ncbi:hypothetical protein J7I86_11860 [Arthrobacter sp. ISL-95]|nr:hypothetical protein [Arthrobacter sp. ISL-95]
MNDPRQTARNLIGEHFITLDRLWIRYWANGGNVTLFDLDAYLYEIQDPPPVDLRILAWAVEDLREADSRH